MKNPYNKFLDKKYTRHILTIPSMGLFLFIELISVTNLIIEIISAICVLQIIFSVFILMIYDNRKRSYYYFISEQSLRWKLDDELIIRSLITNKPEKYIIKRKDEGFFYLEEVLFSSIVFNFCAWDRVIKNTSYNKRTHEK